MKCKNCPELIKRYGYCQVVDDWVEPQLSVFSFGSAFINNANSQEGIKRENVDKNETY